MLFPKKPNVLFIFTDEQRQDTLRIYGNRKIKTPNLDKLAQESVVFTQAYVTQPVCTPSRASILTGLYPHTNGCVENNIPLKQEIPTIAEMMEYEALQFSPIGHAKDDIDAGTFELTGELPVNTDGGLKSFGHPIGATGVRMVYECYKQLQGKAQLPERQLKNVGWDYP